MTRRVYVILVCAVLLALIHPAGHIGRVNAETVEGAAAFTYVRFQQEKIYEGESANLLFAVSNRNSTETEFYVRVYRDGQMIFDGEPRPFSCSIGETTSEMTVTLDGWIGAETYRINVELHSTPSDTLQDLRPLSLTVVKLTAGEFTFSPSKTVWGRIDKSSLKVNFTNTGNDDMYDVVVTVMNSSLRISPLSSGDLGTVPAGQTVTLTFTLSALDSKGTKPGLHKISMRISFNDYRSISHYQDWTLEFNLEKMQPKILFSFNPPAPKCGDTIKFKAELVDEKKNPLVGELITLSVGSTTVSNETSTYGTAVYELLEGLDSGNHSVKLSYRGSEYYMNTSEIFVMRVSPLATSLHAETQKIVNATIPATVNLSLVDERLRPIPNQTLKITIVSGLMNFSRLEKTDDQGRASFSFSLNASGEAELSASFAGSRNYLESRSHSIIKVTPASTRLALRAIPAVTLDSTIDLEISLRDLLGRPLSDAPITVLVNGEAAARLSTNSTGYAKTALTLQPTVFFRKARVSVAFSGDERSAPSLCETEILVVNSSALAGVLGAVAAGGIVSSLLLVMRWRRLSRRKALPSEVKPVKPRKGELPIIPPLTPLDERVYEYILEHSGVISLSQASKDLGITVEQLEASTKRLRDAGRLAPTD
ncbi:hypothetical protein KEJ39_02960 [Candidatus Bathyarchaeota archaeon]|nr:hypothetical protein [Candidatus Bathyarchaeota archaeon]